MEPHKIRPQINDLLVKIVSDTLEKHPKLDSHFENNEMKIWSNINLGVAMAISDGLISSSDKELHKIKII